MRILVYAGPSPWRDLVLTYSIPFVEKVATALTFVTGGGSEAQSLLDEAVKRFTIPPDIPVMQQIYTGDAQTAILAAAQEVPYDLVILGRLNRSLGRLLPGPRSKVIAQRLRHSVLRVHGIVRPLQSIALASSGNQTTFDNAQLVAQIAAPLQARVSIVHVVSQQSVIFEGFSKHNLGTEKFLSSDVPEARVLRGAAALLNNLGVSTVVTVRAGPVIDELLSEVYMGSHDLLVIGEKRFESVLDRLLLEDVAAHIMDHSPLPVLMAKEE